MRMDVAICIAVLCAGLLPLCFSKAIDKECKNKDIFLIITCVINAIVVYILAMVSTY